MAQIMNKNSIWKDKQESVTSIDTDIDVFIIEHFS